MAKNAEEVVDDDKEVTEEDFRKIKEEGEVESSEEQDESQESETQEESEEADEDETSESQEEESEEESNDEADEDASDFVKEFPNIKGETIEDYTRELEKTVRLSNIEGKRLSDELKKAQAGEGEGEVQADVSDPLSLYMKQKMDEEINSAYAAFSESYQQVNNPAEYAKFVKEVGVLSQTILNSQGRLAPPSELYSKVAVILDWKPEVMDDKDKLNAAIKNKAAVSKTVSANKPKSSSKVTDAQVTIAKQMGGWTVGKSDAEIRKELENY